jgi:hypothetical protein
MKLSAQAQALVGCVGVSLGVVWMMIGMTAAGELFLLAGGAVALLGLYRWRQDRRSSQSKTSIDEQYLAATGLMFFAGTVYVSHRAVIFASENRAMMFVAFAATLLGLGLTIFTFGGLVALRRSAQGRSAGRLARRLYPILRQKESDDDPTATEPFEKHQR